MDDFVHKGRPHEGPPPPRRVLAANGLNYSASRPPENAAKLRPDPGTAGRPTPYPRGRVLGGSSSINGLIYIRGQPEDFDHWAQLGNRGWGWDDVLPFFM